MTRYLDGCMHLTSLGPRLSPQKLGGGERGSLLKNWEKSEPGTEASIYSYLRVEDGGVVEGVVGEDVSAVVDLLQSQVHHWDGS